MQIDEIRACPDLADTAVDRIWRAWWKEKGHPVSVIADAMARTLASSEPKPFCLVAHDEGGFVGTVSLIASDVPARPLLTPWIAALWVEPVHRGKGVATALLECAVARAFAHGEGRIHLHCAARLLSFYEKRGWTLLEADAPTAGMCIVVRVRS